MNENITRIADLPDTQNSIQAPNMDMGLPNSYIPMNIHPNPYGNNLSPQQQPVFNEPKETREPKNFQLSSEQKMMLENTPYNRLPSRDIPMDTTLYSQDEQIQSNYIPTSKVPHDYVREHEDITEKKMEKYQQEKHKTRMIDTIFTEIQIPFLIALIYFIFQMPFINQLFIKFLPFLQLYNQDGQMNMNGMIFKSVLFGTFYYFTIEICNFISEL